jgi:hypothetical protein
MHGWKPETMGLYVETYTVQIPVACTGVGYAVCHGLWLKYCTGIETELSCVLCFHTYYSIHKILNKPKLLNYSEEKLNSC